MLEKQLTQKAETINSHLASTLESEVSIQQELKDAMQYSLLSSGKRLRAAIAMWACEIISGEVNDSALSAAAAVEMVHTYSLVHDDLPAMDDDDMRRGKPSCHKAFDEATAILAGDGLLTLAFEILSERVEDKSIAIKMVSVLSRACGASGMIAGQMADMQSHATKGDTDLLKYIHTNKTAKMFEASAVMGALAAGATEAQVQCMQEFGVNLGLCFQIVDDILDVTVSSDELGKTAGKDIAQGKITYVSLLGIDKAKSLADKYATKAITALKPFGSQADVLKELASELLQRTK